MIAKTSKTTKISSPPPTKSALKKAKILGVGINSTSYDQVLTWIEQKLASKEKFYIATPNPEMLVAAHSNPTFKAVLNQADLAIPDGTGLIFASFLLSTQPRITRTVTGTDLLEKIAKIASEKHWKLFFLGGSPGVALKATEKLSTKYHLTLDLYQFSSGPQQLFLKDGKLEIGDREADSEITVEINKFQPNLLFVAFGHSKQEQWIINHLPYLKIGGAIGVGGAFDYLAGTTPRAPFIIRKLGFEWVFRLILAPHRFRRIFNAIVVFPYLVLLQKLHPKSV